MVKLGEWTWLRALHSSCDIQTFPYLFLSVIFCLDILLLYLFWLLPLLHCWLLPRWGLSKLTIKTTSITPIPRTGLKPLEGGCAFVYCTRWKKYPFSQTELAN